MGRPIPETGSKFERVIGWKEVRGDYETESVAVVLLPPFVMDLAENSEPESSLLCGLRQANTTLDSTV